jgi:RND family efflux transporter MFP subunit
MPRPSLALLLAIGLLALPAAASADDPKPEGKPGNGEKTEAPEGAPSEKPKEEEKKKEAPPSVAAEKGPFVVWVEASGTLEPVGAAEVRVELDAYAGELEIVEVAPPGPVRKGELLVRLDPEKLDEQLAAAEKDAAIAAQALAKQEEEAKRAEEGARLAMERAVVEKTRADHALEQFTKVDRPLRTKEAEHRLQGTRDNIQDQEEELDQLRKMYQADDLVEGTEEIVMKRSERSLARSKTWLGYQTTRNKTLLEVDLPREQETLELEAKKEAFELDRLRATQPPTLAQSRLELEKARLTAERGSKALSKLRSDRERLTLVSPVDGVAVPGAFAKGKWSGLEDATRALRKGEAVRAKQVLFTVLEPGSVVVRASVPEASLLSVQVGQPAEVTLGVQPDRKLEARVARVARASSDGNFEVHLDLAAKDERWMPGWSAKARVRTTERSAAVTVPAASVTADGDKRFVHVVTEDGAAPREVTVGATSGGRTEIVAGLEAGERVLKSPPKKRDEKKDEESKDK